MFTFVALLACEEGLQNMKQDSFLCLLAAETNTAHAHPFQYKFYSHWVWWHILVQDTLYVFRQNANCWAMAFQNFQVAKDPSGKDINALEQHIKNLLSPSTPFFFNTLYDPYRVGADFVRGYPFSLREGVPTAVSHGLWLNIPDYDAPTQLVKPLERNTR